MRIYQTYRTLRNRTVWRYQYPVEELTRRQFSMIALCMMFMNCWNICGRMLASLLSFRPWRISGDMLEKWNNRGRYTMIPLSCGYRSRFLVMIAKFPPRRKWDVFLFRAPCGGQELPETPVSWFGPFVNHWALVLQLQIFWGIQSCWKNKFNIRFPCGLMLHVHNSPSQAMPAFIQFYNDLCGAWT